QIRLRWALAAAALLLGSAAWLRRDQYQPVITLALLYTLAGALTAVGVGKVGAYSNYFLELYAGLVWMIAGLQPANARLLLPATHRAPPAARLLPLVSCLFLIVALLYYPPLWDPDRPRQAGLLAPSPPRIIFGRYGLWDDARREADLLAAFGRVDLALEREVRAAGPQIFTDMPGTAAAAGVVSRMQVFEARQLLDQGLDEQFNLLADLADGSPPLAVIDYLGNWLTPEIIAVLRHRYAQDGSLGTFNLYRPVDTGPSQLLNSPIVLGSNLMLSDYALAAPLSAAYEPGELLTLALGWQYVGTTPAESDLAVVVQLTAPGGGALLEDELPLLYNAFPPDRWPAGRTIQHLQTLALPDELPPGRYGLAVGLRAKGLPLEEPYPLIEIVVQAAGGRTFAETSYFVPAPIMRTWAELGAIERMGLPLTPAVPFAWGQLQCFELACLELRDNTVQLRNVGEQLYLSETARSTGCPDKTLESGLCEGFAELAERYGVSLGTPVSGEMDRNGWIVQWTKNARLERWPAKGMQGLGRLGDESLRLSPGERYRWP
ncbi:MAG: hypothetical protein HGA19_23225, partial [Oscillochloris sp.]|nr:hypothetical protein [Oscillochloris sp.]